MPLEPDMHVYFFCNIYIVFNKNELLYYRIVSNFSRKRQGIVVSDFCREGHCKWKLASGHFSVFSANAPSSSLTLVPCEKFPVSSTW